MNSTASETTELPIDALLEDARRAADLDDFGDPWFMEPLGKLVAFVNAEAALISTHNPSVQVLVDYLMDRLRLVDYLKKNPGVRDEKVDVAGIIFGIPRGGSTMFQRLLCASPKVTSPYLWEMMATFPLPGEKPGDPSPRINQVQVILDERNRAWPDSTAIHPMYATAYDEESFLISRSFMSVDFIFYFHLPNYVTWLKTQDQTKAYEELNLWLQVIQYQDPSRRGKKWLLKSGHHMWCGGMPFAMKTFPRAAALMTHRSLENVIPSCCSLQGTFLEGHTRDFESRVLGRENVKLYREAIEDLFDVRKGPYGDRFADFQYKDLVSDPLNQYKRALEAMGIIVDKEDEKAALAWIKESKRDAHSRHAYSPEDFDLTQEQITDEFKFYTDHYLAP